MNKSPDSRKKSKRRKVKPAPDKEVAKIVKQEGTGIGGVQTGTQSDEKPSKSRKTSREVRDLG